MSEVSAKPTPDEINEAEKAIGKLEIKEETPHVDGDVDVKSNGHANEANSSSVEEKETEQTSDSVPQTDAEALVDHALRDALSRYKHRNTVLRLEAEVQDFILNSTEDSHQFPGEMSSYDRLLIHRTAQHWGLDTSTVNQGPDQGNIIAIRTPRTNVPDLKLADLKVVMEESAVSVDTNQINGGSSPSAPPQPKLLVRKPREQNNNNRYQNGGNMRGGHNNMKSPPQYQAYPAQRPSGMPYPPPMMSYGGNAERELHYERARARIFGGDAMGAMHPYGMPGGQQQYPMVLSPTSSPQPYMPPSSPRTVNMTSSNSNNNNTSNSNHPTKAQLRNRQQDLSDPDFRRGSGGRGGPRFDPGFNEDMQGGMYIRPTYSSEFPELGMGPPGPHHPAYATSMAAAQQAMQMQMMAAAAAAQSQHPYVYMAGPAPTQPPHQGGPATMRGRMSDSNSNHPRTNVNNPNTHVINNAMMPSNGRNNSMNNTMYPPNPGFAVAYSPYGPTAYMPAYMPMMPIFNPGSPSAPGGMAAMSMTTPSEMMAASPSSRHTASGPQNGRGGGQHWPAHHNNQPPAHHFNTNTNSNSRNNNGKWQNGGTKQNVSSSQNTTPRAPSEVASSVEA